MSTPVQIEELLTRVDNLPTLSHVAMRVGELVADPRSGPKEIADAMRSDPSLSAKVLRLVNSSYYAIPGGVSDVSRAISFVGFNTLHQLVLSVSVLGSLKTDDAGQRHMRGLWLHALSVGVCAEVLARRIGHRDPGSCFTAGLLHDVGKIALLSTEPTRYSAAIDDAKSRSLTMSESEKQAGLPTHDKVGQRLARRWKFPLALAAPIELHHGIDNPQTRRDGNPQLIACIDIVNISDALCRQFALGEGGSPKPDMALLPLDRIGVSTTHIGEIHTDLMHRLEKSKVFLELIE